jgi:hypothetical protein
MFAMLKHTSLLLAKGPYFFFVPVVTMMIALGIHKTSYDHLKFKITRPTLKL